MTLRARDVMTRNVLTLHPSTELSEAARELARTGVSGAPVCNDEGRLVGILSKSDLLDALYDGRRERAHIVADAMSTSVLTVPPDEPCKQMAERMVFECVHRLVVVEGLEVVGVVTPLDLLRGTQRREQSGNAMSG